LGSGLTFSGAFRARSTVRGVLLSLAGALAFSCSDKRNPDNPSPTTCEPSGPAFHLQLRAEGDDLPPDFSVTARYQGNLEETFSVRGRSHNEDLCCQLGSWSETGPVPETVCAGRPSDAGAGNALNCTLWSNGAATISLSAHGYEELTEDLVATFDEECEIVLTSDVRLVLERHDAGPPSAD
jgi:hypothetical protein